MKKIAILSTGSEILQGALLDKNANYFCKSIHNLGGNIFQCLQASDETEELHTALNYLLKHADAIIITGGLGPTSDDNTRHAVAAAIQQPLEFNNIAWDHVLDFFSRFNLALNDSNKRQALFPKIAQIIPNPRGTAVGCQIFSDNKWIFMLPGPPNECVPMFETNVIPVLQAQGFFQTTERFQWLTMGLSEGSIAPEVDAIAHPLGAITGYRWDYPYLEIKISCPTAAILQTLKQTLGELLDKNIVSTDGSDVTTQLLNKLATLDKSIVVLGDSNCTAWVEKLQHAKLRIGTGDYTGADLVYKVATSPALDPTAAFSGSLKLSCELQHAGQTLHANSLKIPNRGPEVNNYLPAYFAWQLAMALNK